MDGRLIGWALGAGIGLQQFGPKLKMGGPFALAGPTTEMVVVFNLEPPIPQLLDLKFGGGLMGDPWIQGTRGARAPQHPP